MLHARREEWADQDAFLEDAFERGWTDGLTTTLRGRFPATRYAGIEIEVNQGLLRKPAAWKQVKRALATVVGTLD